MFGKKNWIKLAMVGAAAIAAGANIASADTITVKSAGVNTSTGVFQYTITLDGTTTINPGDGFVIYDFGGYVSGSASLVETSGAGSLSLSNFTVMTTGNGFGSNLNNPVSVNMLATADAGTHSQLPSMYTDPNSPADGLSSLTFDNPATPNLSFVYSGPQYNTNGGTETYTLTLDTSSTNNNSQVSVSEAVGEDNNPANDGSLSFSENLVYVPLGSNTTVQTAAPMPNASISGLALFGVVGLVRALRGRRLNNA